MLSDPALIRQLCQERRIHEVCSKPPESGSHRVFGNNIGIPAGILPLLRVWQDDLHLYMAFPMCDRGSLYDLWAETKR